MTSNGCKDLYLVEIFYFFVGLKTLGLVKYNETQQYYLYNF